jgi:hypothetical protein
VSTRTSSFRRSSQDHFEPESDLDPQAQRRLRGYLEQIDYTAFACNRDVISQALGPIDMAKFQKLAMAAACARAHWVAAAIAAGDPTHSLTAEQTARLAQLRAAFDELTAAYEGLRRMVERGYVPFKSQA